jgi:hypothetical protein
MKIKVLGIASVVISLFSLIALSSGCQKKEATAPVTVTASSPVVTQTVTFSSPAVTQTATVPVTPVTVTVTTTKEVLITVTPTTPANIPGVPTSTAPLDKSVFTLYPRQTTLKWTAGVGEKPITYLVELQYTSGGDFTTFGSWQEGEYSSNIFTVNTLAYTFNFVGAQPGRWRVKAVNQYGVSAWSEWWYFRYTS